MISMKKPLEQAKIVSWIHFGVTFPEEMNPWCVYINVLKLKKNPFLSHLEAFHCP